MIRRELWLQLQRSTFLENDRYVATQLSPSVDDAYYVGGVRRSLEWSQAAKCKPDARHWAVMAGRRVTGQ